MVLPSRKQVLGQCALALLGLGLAFLGAGFGGVVVRLSPRLAVDLDAFNDALLDAKAKDPWQQPWRYRPPAELRQFGSLVATTPDPSILDVPSAVRGRVAADMYERYSVGPNGRDEGQAGDDIVPRLPALWLRIAPRVFIGIGSFVLWCLVIGNVLVSRRGAPAHEFTVIALAASVPVLVAWCSMWQSWGPLQFQLRKHGYLPASDPTVVPLWVTLVIAPPLVFGALAVAVRHRLRST